MTTSTTSSFGDASPRIPSAAPHANIGGPYAWYVVSILSIVYLVSVCDRFLMSIAIIPLKSALLLTDTQLGLLTGTGFAILYCAISVPIGLLIDHTNRVRMISAGLTIWTLATGACALANSFEYLFIARIFVGLGEAVLVPAGMSLIASYFMKQQLGRATAIFLTGGSLGKIVAYIAGGTLLSYFTIKGGLHFGRYFAPWQALFIAAAAVGIPPLIFLNFTVREPLRPQSTMRPGLQETWSHMLRNRAVYSSHFTYGTCVWIIGNIYSAWAPSFYVRQFHLSVSFAALISGIASLFVAALGYWIGGFATDRLKSRGVNGAPAAIIAIALVMSAAFCVVFTTINNLVVSIVFYGFAELAIMMGAPPALAGVQMLTPVPQRGLTMAVFVSIQTLGSLAIGPTMIGIINDRLFAGQSLGISMALTATAAALLGTPLALIARQSFGRITSQMEGAA
jgi:MFS family permease